MSLPVVLIPGAGGRGWVWHLVEPDIVPGGHLAALGHPAELSAALARYL
jgi:hypothetical protein